MRIGKVPALAGGAAGLVGAAAAAGIVVQRRTAVRERARIDPAMAAELGRLRSDRQSIVRTEDGIALHVEEFGPAEAELTVLFVHGFTLNLHSFHFQLQALRAEFGDRVRLVCYDQRSHGQSAQSDHRGCTIEQLGRDLFDVIDRHAPAGPLLLVGHSMGGMTLMALADQRPELFEDTGRVGSVALINTSSGDLRTITLGLPRALARWQAPLLPIVLRRAAKNAALVEKGRALGRDLAWVVTKRLSFADPAVDPAVVAFCARMIEATPVTVVANFYPSLIGHDGRLGLKNLRDCAVLVLGADSDALTPARHSEQIAAELPAAQLIIAEQSGHLLMLEHPDLVNRPLLALVAAELDEMITLPTVADTRALGRRLAGLLRAGDLVILVGPLGAGKTAFVQGIGAGLGVAGAVVSPTFVIARNHGGGRLPLVHVDAYRLGSLAEVDDLDLDVSVADSVTVVEWGAGLIEQLTEARLEIILTRQADSEVREAELVPVGGDWAARIALLD